MAKLTAPKSNTVSSAGLRTVCSSGQVNSSGGSGNRNGGGRYSNDDGVRFRRGNGWTNAGTNCRARSKSTSSPQSKATKMCSVPARIPSGHAELWEADGKLPVFVIGADMVCSLSQKEPRTQ